jgi:hypothetical protein
LNENGGLIMVGNIKVGCERMYEHSNKHVWILKTSLEQLKDRLKNGLKMANLEGTALLENCIWARLRINQLRMFLYEMETFSRKKTCIPRRGVR